MGSGASIGLQTLSTGNVANKTSASNAIPPPQPPVTLKQMKEKNEKLLDSFQIIQENVNVDRFSNYSEDMVEAFDAHHSPHRNQGGPVFSHSNALLRPILASSTVSQTSMSMVSNDSGRRGSCDVTNGVLSQEHQGFIRRLDSNMNRISTNQENVLEKNLVVEDVNDGTESTKGTSISKSAATSPIRSPKRKSSVSLEYESNGKRYDIQPRKYSKDHTPTNVTGRKLSSEASIMFSHKLHKSISIRAQTRKQSTESNASDGIAKMDLEKVYLGEEVELIVI